MNDRHGALADDLRQRVFDGPGSLEPVIRRSFGSGDGLPDELGRFTGGLRHNTYRVGPDDVAGLLASGYTEDQVYEATISVALAAGARRLDAGLAAVAESFATTPAGAAAPQPQATPPPIEPIVEQPFAPVATVAPASMPLQRRKPGVNLPGGSVPGGSAPGGSK